jgi:dihydropteroate synthase
MGKNSIFDFGTKTYIMGILNVTPDSFSDGGKFFSIDNAVNHALEMEKDGADIIDIGGESTRPGSKPVSVDEEISRVIPVIEQLSNKIRIPLSIDTYKSEVAKKALDLGVAMVNDITALRHDKNLVSIVADFNVPICLMHMKGEPQNMQKNPTYEDVVKEIYDFFDERIKYAISSGIKKQNIIIDPGLGFGKRTGNGIEDNSDIIHRLSELKDLGYPILIGASRKTFIGNMCGCKRPLAVNERLGGSIAAANTAVMNGADIVRVHDVKETRQSLDFVDKIVR